MLKLSECEIECLKIPGLINKLTMTDDRELGTIKNPNDNKTLFTDWRIYIYEIQKIF